MNLVIRAERSGDESAITQVTEAAFRHAAHSSHTEHFIVQALRAAGQLTVSLVAEHNGEIVGHVAISPVSISDGTDRWFGLGPVSVLPDYQGQGTGSRLMQKALAALKAGGADGCVLLGDPGFYSRFGFKAETALVLPEVPPGYFLALHFSDSKPAGNVTYHSAFLSQA